VQVRVGIQAKLDTVEMFSKEKANYVCPQQESNFPAYCLLFSWLLTSRRYVAYRQNYVREREPE